MLKNNFLIFKMSVQLQSWPQKYHAILKKKWNKETKVA